MQTAMDLKKLVTNEPSRKGAITDLIADVSKSRLPDVVETNRPLITQRGLRGDQQGRRSGGRPAYRESAHGYPRPRGALAMGDYRLDAQRFDPRCRWAAFVHGYFRCTRAPMNIPITIFWGRRRVTPECHLDVSGGGARRRRQLAAVWRRHRRTHAGDRLAFPIASVESTLL